MNSPSWTIHPHFSKNVRVLNCSILNPPDSPNTDGIDVESCEDVQIKGCRFDVGDDCVALKSGKIFMSRFNAPTKNAEISDCVMENGHGAVVIGSETACGVSGVYVHDCEFRNTDRGLRVKTRRGRGSLSVIDDIKFENIEMVGVKSPFTVNCFYCRDPDGKSEYVQNRQPAPVTDKTPSIKKLEFSSINCSEASYCAAYFLGLPERKIEKISMKDVNVSFADNVDKLVRK
jgi:polygalacturonase